MTNRIRDNIGSESGGHLLPYFASVASGELALFVEREGGPYEQSAYVVSELTPSSEYWLRIEVEGDSVSLDVRAGSTQGTVVGSTTYESEMSLTPS